MKQLSVTVILTRRHLTPLANMDMKAVTIYSVWNATGSHQQGRSYVSPISSRTLRGVSASCGGKMWNSGKQTWVAWGETDTKGRASFREASSSSVVWADSTTASQWLFPVLCGSHGIFCMHEISVDYWPMCWTLLL